METLRPLAAIRFAVGIGALVAPGTTGRLFGLPDAPEANYTARLFGVRDIALAVGTLQATGEAQRQWTQLGVACDVVDIGSALLARREGTFGLVSTVLTAGTAATAAALGAKALQDAPSSSA
jgi:hypothetical protein